MAREQLARETSPAPESPVAQAAGAFFEKAFYLEEFYRKTLAIAVAPADLDPRSALVSVVEELTSNGTNVIVLSTEAVALGACTQARVLTLDHVERLEGTVWRELKATRCLGLLVPDETRFASVSREVVTRLGIAKLVWIDRDGGLVGPEGERLSFVHLAELCGIVTGVPAPEPRRVQLLREIQAMLEAGIPAVNVCSLPGLHDELFSYSGSGTLFTRERYVIVRRIGIDDFDAASDLIARGTEEGYLAPRSEAQLDCVLASGFGAFIEGHHLAGLGALLVDPEGTHGEVASLYTLTRFLGEGVGAHLVTHALARASELELDYVYACTTSDRVIAFFERHGFEVVSPDRLPRAKWHAYDPDRRARVACLRRDLVPQAERRAQ